MSVPIVYLKSDPREAQIKGVTRSYDRTIFREIVGATLVGSALITFIGIPLWIGMKNFVGRLFPFATNREEVMARAASGLQIEKLEEALSNLSVGDPRRERLEMLLRSYKK